MDRGCHIKGVGDRHPPSGVAFREFVLLFQNDVNFRFGDGSAVPNTAEAEDPEDTGQKALNYRSEPLWKRLGFAPDLPLEQTRDFIFTNALTNGLAGGDPVTPVFTASRPGLPCGSAFCSRPDMRATACSRFTAISGKRSLTPRNP